MVILPNHGTYGSRKCNSWCPDIHKFNDPAYKNQKSKIPKTTKSQNQNFFARFRRCDKFGMFGFLDFWVFGISGSVALWLCGYLGTSTKKCISVCRGGGVEHIYIYIYVHTYTDICMEKERDSLGCFVLLNSIDASKHSEFRSQSSESRPLRSGGPRYRSPAWGLWRCPAQSLGGLRILQALLHLGSKDHTCVRPETRRVRKKQWLVASSCLTGSFGAQGYITALSVGTL